MVEMIDLVVLCLQTGFELDVLALQRFDAGFIAGLTGKGGLCRG